MRVLLVEDDANLRFGVAAALRAAGLAVDEAVDLPQADEALFVTAYDCVVFDRMLPAGDAVEYVEELRRSGRAVPVLFLTARDTVADRVEGFARGGDDYLVKPFAVPELVARVRSLCRRAPAVTPPVLRVGDLEIDTARRRVRRGGVLLTLTSREFAVLEVLADRADQAVSRAELVERCWDEMAEHRSNVLEVLVSQVRRKLGAPPLLHTVRGTAVLDAVSMAMYTPEDQWEPLSRALAAADAGDATELGALDEEEPAPAEEDPADEYPAAEDTGDGTDEDGGDDDGPAAEEPPVDNEGAALTAVNCLDVPHPRDLDAYWDALPRAERAAGVYGTAGVTAELTCRGWPSGARTPHRVDADGVVPVLVVGTTGDPSTPYEEAVSLADQFPGGVLLTYEGMGHTAYGRGDTCVTEQVDAYLVGLKPVRPGATC